MKKELRSLKQAKARIIFVAIWLVIAFFFFFAGLDSFLSAEERTFGNWMFWGFICCFPVIGTVLRSAISSAKSGWKQGANEYTVTVSDTHATVENHPFRGAVLGIIVSIILCVLVGPVMLAFFIIINIISLVQAILYIKNNKPAPQNNELHE